MPPEPLEERLPEPLLSPAAPAAAAEPGPLLPEVVSPSDEQATPQAIAEQVTRPRTAKRRSCMGYPGKKTSKKSPEKGPTFVDPFSSQ
jgi:hypothetical protein